MQAEIGIIGGTGFYDPKLLSDTRTVRVRTPYGAPSDAFQMGNLGGRMCAFLPRHSAKHTIRPTDVNSRANIFAMKKLGVQRILAPSTVGSLREDYRPGDIVLIDQFIDRTTKREQSFYTGRKVCHISVAEPTCRELRQIIAKAAAKTGIKIHDSGTYVCVEGPRFSTKAESRMYRTWEADVVGMTLVPECVLAREAELCYASIAMVTDYDVWKDKPVSAREIAATVKANVEKVKRLINKTIPLIPKDRECECKDALATAMV